MSDHEEHEEEQPQSTTEEEIVSEDTVLKPFRFYENEFPEVRLLFFCFSLFYFLSLFAN